jgi:lactate dehydrogenase-like 2-hydroxyacid dehydrogenase
MNGKVYVTDFLIDHEIEKSVLNSSLVSKTNENVEVLMVFEKIIDKYYIDQFPNLKAIIRYGVGFDSVDLDYSSSRGIYVCNTPDYGVDEVSDSVIAMMLSFTRNIGYYDSISKKLDNDTWKENFLRGTRRTSELNVGVIGAGRIGGSVLKKAKALGFMTSFYDPYAKSGFDKLLGSKRYDTLEGLLRESNIVSINTPLNDETIGLIDEKFISNMADNSILINTARGKIIKNLEIIYEALKTNKLKAVGLDVLPDEPPVNNILINAWRNSEHWLEGRLLINPHVAFYSDDAFIEMRYKASNNALRVIKGFKPINIVNEEALKHFSNTAK